MIFLLLAAIGLLVFISPRFAVVVASGLIATPFLLQDGLYTYYWALPLLLVLQNFGIRLPFAFFSSPLDVLVTLGAGLSILRIGVFRQRVPPSHIYRLIALFIIVAALQTTLAGNPPSFVQITQELVRGLWPLLIIVVWLRTPQQSFRVLFVLMGTLMIALALWLPGIVSDSLAGNYRALRGIDESGGFSLFYHPGSRTYLYIVPIAALIALPISVLVIARQYRVWMFMLIGLMAVFAVSSDIASGLISAFVSAILVLIISLWLQRPTRRTDATAYNSTFFLIIFISIIITGVWSARSYFPTLERSLFRIQNAEQDASAKYRIERLEGAQKTFLSNPILGIGNPEAWQVGGHDSILTPAANWGLIFIVPYITTYVSVIIGLLRLSRQVSTHLEQALIVGMAAYVITIVVTGMITPTLGTLVADQFVWTFAGLTICWRDWKRANPEAPLIVNPHSGSSKPPQSRV